MNRLLFLFLLLLYYRQMGLASRLFPRPEQFKSDYVDGEQEAYAGLPGLAFPIDYRLSLLKIVRMFYP